MDPIAVGRTACKWILLMVVIVETTEGLKCWRCDGKRTVKECHAQFGQMQECNPGDVCQNDFRLANGEVLISKGCKQKIACETEVKQNEDKNQCGSKLFGKNMACRCCCTTTGCNKKKSGCIPPPPPCKRRHLRNGQIFCNRNEIEFGTKCNFRCNPGFKLEGEKSSTCVKDRTKVGKGVWDPAELPECVKTIVRCDPPRENIPNGIVRCEKTKEYLRFPDFNYEGTVCSYFCDKNYYLVGSKATKCLVTGKWSKSAPYCKRGVCQNGVEDRNRINNCTDGFRFGSTCNFRCKEGFKLIGKAKSDCNQNGRSKIGSWTNGLPRCKEIRCSKLTNPVNGKVSCTEESKLGSVCTYTCNEGYDMDKTTRDILTSDCKYTDETRSSADWTRKSPPTCSKIRCVPPHQNPSNGKASCTDKNWLDSSCKLSCNDGYSFDETDDTVDVLRSTCKNDGDGDRFGKWTQANVDCRPVECEWESLNLENSVLGCTNNNRMGSECTIECEEGFTFQGIVNTTRMITKCDMAHSGKIKQSAAWTKIDAICVPITCNRLDPVQNGVMECSNVNRNVDVNQRMPLGTNCDFACNEGYRLDGKQQIWCEDLQKDNDEIGDWTDPQPTCVLNPCPKPVFDTFSVMQDCMPREESEFVDFGMDTQCRYLCKNEGMYMVEDSSNEAILNDAVTSTCMGQVWSDSPPRCEMKICDPEVLSRVTYGYSPRCTDGNKYGSTCTFMCKEKYELTQSEPLTCISDGSNGPLGIWDNEVPSCKRSHCDDFGRVKHGTLDCTDGSRIGSVCALTCNDRYTVKYHEETECLDTIEWSRRRFFCCVKCIFNRRIRILAVFDASAFSSRLDWEYMVDFTESYLTLLVSSGFDVEFSTFLYGRNVDVKSTYPITKLYNRENISAAGEHLEYMCGRDCLREDAGYTGRALSYINDKVFPEVDEEREHFIVIRTTGRSMDRMSKIARELRQKNINILAVGIKNKRDVDRQLMDIAGKKRNFLSVTNPRDLKDIPAKIMAISRDTGCTEASKSRQCP